MAKTNSDRGWSGEVLAMLALRPAADAGLGALADALTASGDDKRKAARAALSKAVANGAGREIEARILERVNVSDSTGRTSEADWKHGKLADRVALIFALLDDAKEV